MFAEMTMLRKLMLLKAASGGNVVEDTATGNPVTFLTDIARPLKSLIANFLPVQTGSGDPAPDNVRPITGWTGITVNHGGKNLLNTAKKVVYSVTTVGVGSAYGGYETKLKAGTYTFSIEFLNSEHYGVYMKEKNDDSTVTLWTAQTTTTEKTITIDTDGEYNIWCYRSQQGGGVDAENIGDFQLEVGSSATSYEPYTAPTIYHVTWTSEGTVYGGYVDLVTGEVWGTWGEIASYDGETLPGRWLSDRDVYSAGGTPTTGAQVVYEFASPVLITTLTPAQITALIGNNTVWSDANGDCEVTFLKKG